LEVVEEFLDMGVAVMGRVEAYRGEQQVHHHQEHQLHRGVRRGVQVLEADQHQELVKEVEDVQQHLDQKDAFHKS